MKFLAFGLLVALASAGCTNKGWSYCSSSKKCGAGLGDCDNNSHCKSGLSCVSSKAGQPLWGWAVDCCQCPALVTSVGGWSACTNDCPCGEGGGDCDSNTQCKGTLICQSTTVGQPVPGAAKDKCVKPCPTVTTVGGWSACTNACPCNEGGGDCDSDAQCKGTLKCVSTTKGQPIGGAAKDKCVKPCSGASSVGGWSACTKSKPCCAGGGDCDNDAECWGHLKCVSTKSGQPVPGYAKDKCAIVAEAEDAVEAEPAEAEAEPVEGEAEAEAAEPVEDEAEAVEGEVEGEAEIEGELETEE